jgi:phospholipid/cholesterol/gamma-HCH transport system permease protein
MNTAERQGRTSGATPIPGRRFEGLTEIPGYRRVEVASGIVRLLFTTVRIAVRPPFSWGGTWLEECSLTIRRCSAPLIISFATFSIGIVVSLIAGLLQAIGTIDRAGGGNITGWTREVGFWLTSMILAGVAGSAMTADLAARKVRDELDAVTVLGINPIRSLVVPRIAAIAFTAPILGLMGVLTATAVSYVFEPMLLSNLTQAAFIDSAIPFMNVPDVLSLIAKLIVGGIFVGVVCCYKGLSAKGGAEGVGRAVNEAVLITFVGLWLLNSLWNAVFLASQPSVQVLRG